MQNKNTNQPPSYTWINVLISFILLLIFGAAEILVGGAISLLVIPAIFLILTQMDRINFSNRQIADTKAELENVKKELEEIKSLLQKDSSDSENEQ